MFRAVLVLSLLLLAATAQAGGVPVEEATDEQKEAAQTAYQSGRDAYDERRFVDALKSFRESYDIVSSPNTHLMIAHTLRELGRNADAYNELVLAAEQATIAAKRDPKYNDSVALANEELALMRKQVGLVRLKIVGANEVAKIAVGDREIVPEQWTKQIPINPGKATFVVTLSDGRTIVRELEVEANGDHVLRVDTADKPAPEPGEPTPDPGGLAFQEVPFDWDAPLRIASYAIAGAGVVALGVAGGLFGAARATYRDLEDECGLAPCPQRQDDVDQGRMFQTVSTILLIAGGALVAGGVVLFFVAPDESPTQSGMTLRIGPGSFALETRF